MRTLRTVCIWLLFVAGAGLTTWLYLDTYGLLPGPEPDFDKVADLGALTPEGGAGGRRSWLVEQKTLLEVELGRHGGSPDAARARALMDSGVELFAQRDFGGAELKFKEGLAVLSGRHGGPVPAATASAPTTSVAATPALSRAAGQPTAAPSATPTGAAAGPGRRLTGRGGELQGKLARLEARLAAVKEESASKDEAFLLMDRAFNSLMSGKLRDAEYFVREAEVAVENLEP